MAGETGVANEKGKLMISIPGQLRSLFARLRKPVESEYSTRLRNEIANFKDCEIVHDLPEIFHYWSNRYLLPKYQELGYTHPEDFFLKQIAVACQNHSHVNAVSIGAGNCDAEIGISRQLLAQGISNFHFDCLDINPSMLSRGESQAKQEGVQSHVSGLQGDFNAWRPAKKYEIVMANQSLHHVLELEHLFSAVQAAMTDGGQFLVSDMIGRNGHQRWPEAWDAMQPFWEELPQPYRYNRLMQRQEETYLNHDCSSESFEGIRAQDILPLLIQNFHFELFIPFGNIIFIFIDRPFGHNFDASADWDRDFIDRVHARDEQGIMSGELTPTQMLAVLVKEPVETRLVDPGLTPSFCIREP